MDGMHAIGLVVLIPSAPLPAAGISRYHNHGGKWSDTDIL